MNKKQVVGFISGVLLAGSVLISYQGEESNSQQEADEVPAEQPNSSGLTISSASSGDDNLQSYRTDYDGELERLKAKVTPLFEILNDVPGVSKRNARQANVEEGRNRRYGNMGAFSNSYGDYAQPSSYGGGGCCSQSNDLLPILALVALSLLLLYLIVLATTTTAAARRRRRSQKFISEPEHNDVAYEDNINGVDDAVYLDGPTWLSLIHELWEQDGVVEDPSCAQHTLCRMNNMAMSAPGQAGWAVSMSSLPLSYLLHRRHDGGFSLYMDAALMGRSGANCTLLYNACSRLH